MKNSLKRFSSLIFIFFLVLTMSLSISIASEIKGEEVELPEPQGACSSDSCSPAKPCPSPDESCYSSNGVFYCCVEPPFPGAESVGN